MLLDNATGFSKNDSNILIIISLIFIIVSFIGLIIIIARMLHVRKKYMNSVDAKIIDIKKENDSRYSHLDYSSNTSLSKQGGTFYVIADFEAINIDGIEYESRIAKLAPHKEEVGDILTLKYNMDKPNLVRYKGYHDYILALSIFGLFFIVYTIILIIVL